MNDYRREEELLRQELRRREPRHGFADRVLARLDERQRAPVPERASWWSWLMAPAMAAVLIAVLGLGAWQYQRVERERQQRARAEQALGQFARAMQITASKLELAQTRVFRTGEQQ